MLWITLGLNLGAAAVKLVAGAASGSLALLGGGLDSIFDGAANVFGVVAMRVASRPPDAEHPYGHRKAETLVAVVIALLLLITCGRLAWQSIQVIPEVLDGSWALSVGRATILAPAIAFGFNWLASAYEARRGRDLGSELLLSDAAHTRADAIVSLALIAGLFAVRAGFPLVDPVLALIVSGVIARTGIQIIRDTGAVLADAAALDPEQVIALALEVPGVAGAHKVRSRGPADAVSIDLHIQVDPTLDIARAHAIGHAVQARLREQVPGVADVVVHVEPD